MENDPRILELLKKMTPEQKLNAAAQMYWGARELKAAMLRHFHADWSEERIEQEVRYAFLTARS
jgi:hypothetical protein